MRMRCQHRTNKTADHEPRSGLQCARASNACLRHVVWCKHVTHLHTVRSMTSRGAIRTALTPFAATLKLAYSSVAFKLTAQHFQRDSTLAQCSLNGLRHLARSSTAAPHTTACSLAQPGVPRASTGTRSCCHTRAVSCGVLCDSLAPLFGAVDALCPGAHRQASLAAICLGTLAVLLQPQPQEHRASAVRGLGSQRSTHTNSNWHFSLGLPVAPHASLTSRSAVSVHRVIHVAPRPPNSSLAQVTLTAVARRASTSCAAHPHPSLTLVAQPRDQEGARSTVATHETAAQLNTCHAGVAPGLLERSGKASEGTKISREEWQEPRVPPHQAQLLTMKRARCYNSVGQTHARTPEQSRIRRHSSATMELHPGDSSST
uniref:Uncharacterized protein TVY486_BAC12E19_002 n=1 Tax=Trypanosoma vivax (strain Y486) TaxID=1055687 RepID=G0W2W2_TRYVY|nr:unnamed protein product [Trypanosoma vivax Y486]